jgi:hypothetical protein
MNISNRGNSRQKQIFLSYAEADKEVALRIADALHGVGLKVLFNAWELAPEDSIATQIKQAVSSSDFLLILLSPRSVASRWMQSELNIALAREMKDRAITVIPAVIEECEIPPFLAGQQYLDLRYDLTSGIQRLAHQLVGAPNIELFRLDWQTFENLVGDLLTELGFSIQRTPLIRDSGFDFIASFRFRDPFGGERLDKWLVQVKFYRDQRVSVSELQKMLGNLMFSKAATKGLVVTNSRLTSVARGFLAEITEKSEKSGYELRVIDGTELTNFLIQHPKLIERYFPRGDRQ